MRRRFVALDCGTNRNAVGAFAPTSDGQLLLVDFALVPVESGTGGEAALLRQLAATFSHRGMPGRAADPLVVAPPAHLTVLRFLRTAAGNGPAEALRAEAERHIPYPLAEVTWAAEPVHADPAGTDWVLAAVKREVTEGLCAVARHGRRRVGRIVPAGLALAWACRYNYPEIRGTALVLEAGRRACTLVFVGPGRRVLVRTVALAGARVPGAVTVAVGGETPFARGAEDDAAPPKEAEPAVRAGRLSLEINRAMALLQGGGQGRLEALLLAGDVEAGDELGPHLADRADRPVERFDPLRRVRCPPGAAAAGAQLAVVVGLAAVVVADPPVALDLLPARLQRAAALRRRHPWWLAAGALGVASLFALAAGSWRAAQICRARVGSLEARLAPLRGLDARNRADLAEIAAAREECALLDGRLAAKARWTGLLAGLQERLHAVDGAWLDRLELLPPAGGDRAPAAPALLTAALSPREGDTGPLRVRIAGRLLEPPGREGRRGGPERAAGLLRGLAGLAGIEAVAEERFDDSRPGVLGFECTLVLDRAQPL